MHTASTSALDPKLLGHISELNRQLLELLSATARGQPTGVITPVVRALRAQWEQLSPEALRRLAACPYLLLDLSVDELSQTLDAGDAIHEPALARPPAITPVAPSLSTELQWRALLTAWHFAQTNPLAARISLGLAPADSARLATVPLPQLEAAVTRRNWRLRLRWEDRVDVWQQLLQAATESQSRRLRQLQLRGLQLLAGQLLPGTRV